MSCNRILYLALLLLALSLQNEGPSSCFKTKRNIFLFVSGDEINSHSSKNDASEKEEDSNNIIVNNATIQEAVNDDESNARNERNDPVDTIIAVDSNNVEEDEISAKKDEIIIISNETKNDANDNIENITVQVIQQQEQDKGGTTTKIDEVNGPILVDEVVIIEEEPLVENGLLVLDHENLLDTMMGKTFNRNDIVNTTGAETLSSSQFSSKLLLLAFYEPWCQKSNDMIRKLEDAIHLLQQKFDTTPSLQLFAKEKNIPQPMIGKMDTSAFENEDLIEFFTLFDNTQNGLPVLKFVFIEDHRDGDDENDWSSDEGDGGMDDMMDYGKIDENDVEDDNVDDDSEDGINDQKGVERTIIDFVGDSKTAEDIVETVIHYWYRFVVSGHISYETLQQESIIQEENDYNKTLDLDYIKETGDNLIRPIFAFADLPSILSFVQTHKKLFQPIMQELTGVSEREETYIRDLLVAESGDDPYLAFVQCRNHKQVEINDEVVSLYQQFDDLAQTFIYRRDVAFFVVISESCHWISDGSYIDADAGFNWNGFVRTLKIDTSRQYLNNQEWWKLGQTFPSTTTHDHSNMTQYIIVQSTPTVLWYDKIATSALAFPMYRKVHLVLFIDMHTSRLNDGSFNYTSIAYSQSKRAISQLREAALHHRLSRPTEGVVFLIVPSTEVQILTTFGIDIWSSMDHTCSESDSNQYHPREIPQLPMVMMTSRRESNSTMLRYYLHSDELNGQGIENKIDSFIKKYYKGYLEHHLQSESKSSESTLSSGVQTVNGNSFEKLVMLSKKHTIVQFTAPYCGHCKRFNIIWNELAILVKSFNWDTVLDVMVIDVTKNDVVHDMIDVQNVPSVYFFPKTKKDVPSQLLIKGNKKTESSNIGEINEASSIIEWMINSNFFDENELLKLIEQSTTTGVS